MVLCQPEPSYQVARTAEPRSALVTITARRESGDQETSLPTGQASASAFQPLVTFLPDGTAQDNGQIALKTVGVRQAVIVKFQAASGLLTAKEG